MVDPPDIACPHDHYHRHLDARHQSHSHPVQGQVKQVRKSSQRKAFFPIALIAFICLALFSSLSATASATVLASRDDNGLRLPPNRDVHDDSAAAVVSPQVARHLLDTNSYSGAARDDALDLIQRLVALQGRQDTLPPPRRWVSSFSGVSPRPQLHTYAKRDDLSQGQRIGYGIIVPILVILSGIFAGLTLGYMSLDETQLQVLSSTGTEKQKKAAQKIVPIRKDGHLLLTTLLIANMITNETLPVVSEPLFPTKILAVVVPTVLIIIFAELVPQSVCSRYGLEIGAFMALPTRIVMLVLWPVAFPVSRVLHWTLGPHHGIVYRRAELKELVTMHAASGGRGGDLKGDTVMMVGGALDLQEKVAKEAMTPIDRVFMLPLDAKLDYPTLERVVRSGHSRIPIYQEVEVPVSMKSGTNTPSKRGLPTLFNALTRRGTANSAKQLTGANSTDADSKADQQTQSSTNAGSLTPPPTGSAGNAPTTEMIKRKKIVGTLLVKSCVLLDPEDAVPVSDMTINALPSVPNDEPLLNVLNAFQEGRSHMAIVTALSRSQSSIDPAAVKGIAAKSTVQPTAPRTDGLSDIDEERQIDSFGRHSTTSSSMSHSSNSDDGEHGTRKLRGFWKKHFGHEASLEQSMPSDATLADGNPGATLNEELSPNARGDILGIITLEDVLEELIGEEIYDEYDPREDGDSAWNNVTPPMSPDGPQGNGATDAVLEKRMIDAHAAGVALPPAAYNGVIASDGTQSTEKTESTTSQGAPRTLFSRLGLSGRKSGSTFESNREARSSPVPEGGEEKAAAAAAAVPLETIQDGPDTGRTNTSSHADEGPDYLNALAAGTPSEPVSEVRDPSFRPTAVPSRMLRSSSASRPSSPGVTVLPEATDIVTGSPVAQSQHPLASPQPSRPVVLRKQRPDGSTQNVIVGEHLLRGRRVAPGTPAGGSELLGVGGDSSSRSSTPKPSRFKSAPVQQPRGRSVSTDPTARRQNTTASLEESQAEPESDSKQ